MYTVHLRPRSAQAVAVATPCCPAPVSAITRGLPMCFASSAWPSTLLILCAPGARPRHSHGDPTSLAPHERLTDLAVVPREKAHTGAAAREQPQDSPGMVASSSPAMISMTRATCASMIDR